MTIDVPQQHEEKNDSEQKKLSMKRQLMKLFLTSDIKNAKLWKPLRLSKTELIRNLHDGWFDVAKVNSLFWIYFHDHKDIHTPRHLKWLISKQHVFVDRVDHPFSLDEYLFILKKIRVALEPFTKSIQKLLDLSKAVAPKNTDNLAVSSKQKADEDYHPMFTKQQLVNEASSELHADEICTDTWFSSLCTTIWTTREQNNYQDLILFAVLGMHYFDKKQLVYSAFSQEDVENATLHFEASTRHEASIDLSLWEFLAIVDQLNFKKHFFDL